ncbi:MAG: SURF1 family protein [Gammaproteobacteria bacterium]|nr:SURF1 family protein [Gammaproteobacteria bacterium]
MRTPLPPGPVRRAVMRVLAFAALALAGAALCVRLGLWQWQRGMQREAETARFARGSERLVDLGARAVTDVPLYQRVRVQGELDGAHQFLLDNRTWRGRAGYEVLTPLRRRRGDALLVDRGWVPFGGTRASLPEVGLAGAPPATLTGRLALLPSAGLASGRAAPAAGASWPKVASYPTIPELSAALAVPLSSRILLLDPGTPFGYVRDWQAPGLPALRHFAYAIQWWTFAALIVVLWGVMSVRLRLRLRRAARIEGARA